MLTITLRHAPPLPADAQREPDPQIKLPFEISARAKAPAYLSVRRNCRSQFSRRGADRGAIRPPFRQSGFPAQETPRGFLRKKRRDLGKMVKMVASKIRSNLSQTTQVPGFFVRKTPNRLPPLGYAQRRRRRPPGCVTD